MSFGALNNGLFYSEQVDDELQQVMGNTTQGGSGFNVASGLKQALEMGVSSGVDC